MNIIDKLHINVIQSTKNNLIIEMPITEESLQPFGIMHGGLNSLLAETAASLGANLYLDTTKEVAVGFDIHTTHLKPMNLGTLKAVAKPNHVGKTTQTWEVKTYNSETDDLISTSTVNLLKRQL